MGMLLGIVVGLIGVVGGRIGAIDSGGGIFACGVVATVGTVDAIGGVVIHSIPTHTGFLATAKEAAYDFCFGAIPTEVTVVGVEVGGSAIEESVGVDLGESGIGTPLVGQHDVGIDHLAEGVVHTAVEGDAYG